MSPQHGQRPSSLIGPVASARNQCPRASHIGLMHCTVKPGKYCIFPPLMWPVRRHRTLAARRRGPLPAKKCNGCRALCARVTGVSRGNTTTSWGGIAKLQTLDFHRVCPRPLRSDLPILCARSSSAHGLTVVVAFAATHYSGNLFASQLPQDRRKRCTSPGWIQQLARECGSWRQKWQTVRADPASP